MMSEAMKQLEVFRSDAARGKVNLDAHRQFFRILDEANKLYPYGCQHSEETLK